MTNDELRDGLANILVGYSPCGCLECQDSCHEQADEILAYLHQHNDFARRVREVAMQSAICNAQVIAMCDEELGNG